MKKGEHTKKASLGSMVRKRLSDITNSHLPSKSPVPDLKLSSTDNCSDKDLIENLVKENLALAKIIEDKNKIIELSGNVLNKLRVNLQKMQMQNWNLALTNSNMLAELNLGKDKLKILNHEISCKNAVIKTKDLEIKEMVKTNKIQKSCSSQAVEEVNKCDEKEERIKSLKLVRRPTRRSQSMGSLLAKEIMEIPENKRRCLKRQSSARFKSREQEEELKEDDDEEEEEEEGTTTVNNNCPMYEEKEEEDDSSLMVSIERKNNDGGESDRRRRGSSSMGIRPLRKATEKVHSYREIPINIKMRR